MSEIPNVIVGVAAPIAVGTMMLVFYFLGMPEYLILKPFIWKL